jgi:hypothetical protein
LIKLGKNGQQNPALFEHRWSDGGSPNSPQGTLRQVGFIELHYFVFHF